ncbi:hypothetical protein GCM10009837_27500 [Streptomyces durmitorensis]|uniref:Lipoprotein n=1 Tax=Streptomyces durmitorensis TaxID=319947 RepID=A0ABY4PUJ3_9ACTN|nr:hypothetical protein [Streptomyces durmitorensis]UQT56604.1 hypothetical protein M4V62_16690 [Streptomyces durmitorensis]
MNIRRTMKTRRAMTAVAITTGLVLTVAGCGGGGDDDKSDQGSKSSASAKGDDGGDDKKESQAPPADETLAESKGDGVTLVINSAKRDEGGFLTVSGKVTNTSGGLWTGGQWRGDEKELQKNGGSIAGASLVDEQGKKRYLVLRDTTGRCLCTKFEGGIDSGNTADWFAQFPSPPEGTNKLTFQVGGMAPAAIELSESE